MHHPLKAAIIRLGGTDGVLRGRATGTALLAIAMAIVLYLHTSSPATTPPPAPLVSAVDGVAMTVANMDRAVQFYAKVLFFEPVSDVEVGGPEHERLLGWPGLRLRVVRMRLGGEVIELTQAVAPEGAQPQRDARMSERSFHHIAIVVNDIDQASLWLRRHKVDYVAKVDRLSAEPRRHPNRNPDPAIRAVHFRDPDGYPLEILQFPPGTGDARWRRPTDQVFLGIDHIGIAVADTAGSLALYRDAFGMTVTGSRDSAASHERSSRSAGVRRRLTTLRAASGPGIELLEDLSSRTGRAAPARSNDDHRGTRTLLSVAQLQDAVRSLGAPTGGLVSSGIVTLPAGGAEPRDGLILRDADGHVLQLRAR